MRVTALLLCGGRATRMGGVDKPLQTFRGRPLVEHVLDRIAPQTGGRVLISANRHLDDYRRLGYPVLEDTLPDFPGPLAGILAGLASMNAGPDTPSTTAETRAVQAADDRWLLVVSGDSPWLPADLLARLVDGLAPGQSAAMALGREAPGEPLRSQPLASLVHASHRASLAAALRGRAACRTLAGQPAAGARRLRPTGRRTRLRQHQRQERA
ncbi:molybdenum cofactor guanylyltransferase [Roseateles chitinivorans]|uniref:molybdenum cofactor guanylyltransferase n=1 Tax=Roseateles chitinivorans TaxID=2917965 RepID=UPI003D66FC31